MRRSRGAAFWVSRWVLAVAVCVLMGAAAGARAQVGGYGTVETVGEGKDAIKKVIVGGTRYQMGYWYGRLLAEDVAGCIDAIMAYADQPDEAFQQAEAAMWNPAFFDTAAYDQELQGMADGCAAGGHPEVTEQRLRWAQLVPDMSEYNCSLFSAWGDATAGGDLYQLRQLDWAMDAGVQDFPVVAIFEPVDGHRHAIIGFAGSLGISGGGMNEMGIAQSEIMGAFDDPETLIGTPFPLLLRESLYHDATLSEALTRMQNAIRTNNYYYCISGPEGDGMEGRLLLTSNSRFDVYQDNESVDPHPKYGAVFHTSFDDAVYWTRHNGDRNDELYAAINANYGSIGKDASIAIAQACAAADGGSLLSVIYNATQREFWVAFADGPNNPAPDEPFIHFALGGPDEGTALDKYVHKPDPTTTYSLANTWSGSLDPYGVFGYTVYVLELTSQTWRSPADVDPSVWKHWLTILVPDDVSFDKALLLIDGGRNGNPAPTDVDERVILMAMSTGSVVANLSQIPNQPTKFGYEGFANGYSEDAIIARTFRRFAEEEYGVADEPTWPLLLPMVKSAVRAMDTVQGFLGDPNYVTSPVDIESFVVTGASKRGWTTWLTGAVDDRVEAIAPLVIDMLNMDEHMAHHFDVYGFWAEAIGDYESQNIMPELDTPMGQALIGIVDPYTYIDRPRIRSMPKYVVNGSGDQFFIPDSTQFYWDDLWGEKLLRFIPNAGHSLGTDGVAENEDTAADVLGGLLGFYYSVLTEQPRSNITWSVEGYDTIRVQTDVNNPPIGVKLWQTTVQGTGPEGTSRDFRIETIAANDWWWTSSPLTDQGNGVYVGKVPIPQAGWTGFFVEVEYAPPTIPSMPPQIPGGPSIPDPKHKLSTQVRIVPESDETAVLTVDVNNPDWGSVELSPEPMEADGSYEYRLGTEVSLTAAAEPNYTLLHWLVYDPNFPDDANHAVEDANSVGKVVMDGDRRVEAVFGEALAVTVTADPPVIAEGNASTLTATATGGAGDYTYLWSTGETTPSITVSPTETTGYSVSVKDKSDNEVIGAATVTVSEGIVVTITVDKPNILLGESSTLTAEAAAGAPEYTYTWSTGETGPSITVSPTETTQYTVTVIDTQDQEATASATVTLVDALVAEIQTPVPAVAQGGSADLTAAPIGGLAPFTYDWSTGESTETITVSPAVTSDYSVTITDALNQQSQATITIAVAEALAVTATADDPKLPAGGTTTLNAGVQGGYGPFSYDWSTGEEGQQIEVTPPGTRTYRVMVTDAVNQVADATVVVEIVSAPTITLEASRKVVEQGGSSELSAAASGGVEPYTFQWSTGQVGPQATVSPVGTTVYQVTVTDDLGQQATATTTIEVASGVQVTAVSEPARIVPGETAILTAGSSGGLDPYTYTWSHGAQGISVQVSPTQTTTYIVTSTDALGQAAQAAVTVTVSEPLSVQAMAEPNVVAAGRSCVLMASASGGAAPYTYAWNGGQTGQTIRVSPPESRSYTVTAKDSRNRTASATIVVQVQPHHALTVSVQGDGKVNPAGGSYPHNSEITLSATPAQGWTFAFWGGKLGAKVNASANPVTVTMTSAMDVTAVFLPEAAAKPAPPNNQANPFVPPTNGCATMVGAGQLLGFWGLCGLGLMGLSFWRRRWR